jgi:hypothetical protein
MITAKIQSMKPPLSNVIAEAIAVPSGRLARSAAPISFVLLDLEPAWAGVWSAEP